MIQQQNNLKTHISAYFKEIKLQELKPIMYQAFLNHLADHQYSKSTIEIVHNTMNSALEKAVTLGKLEHNPCKGVTIKDTKKAKGLKFIESKDIPAFFQAAHQYGYIYWIFFKVLIETGLRKGEAAALQWTDINLKEQTITINKTLDFSAEEEEKLFGETKTYNSERTIKSHNSLLMF